MENAKSLTKVINLYAGPGTGKSTTAAGLFYEMKLRGYDVELVREYAKNFAYGYELPSQPYLFAKQLKAESQLYNKVDWIITDSPLYLSAVYGDPMIFASLVKGVSLVKQDFNFFLKRFKPYHQNGRYQNEVEARLLDDRIKVVLDMHHVPYTIVEEYDRFRVDRILNDLALQGVTHG